MAKIIVNRRSVTPSSLRGTPIGAHEYFLEFEVEVESDGCHALDVQLYDHDRVTFDDIVAKATGSEVPCFCMKAGQPKKFFVTGAGTPPAGERELTSNGQRLPSLSGSWPNSDGYADNTIELFAVIGLYRCADGACEGTQCTPIPRRRLDDPLDVWTTFTADVDIVDGTGWSELLDLVTGLFGLARGLLAARANRVRRGADTRTAGAGRRNHAIAMARRRPPG